MDERLASSLFGGLDLVGHGVEVLREPGIRVVVYPNLDTVNP